MLKEKALENIKKRKEDAVIRRMERLIESIETTEKSLASLKETLGILESLSLDEAYERYGRSEGGCTIGIYNGG